MPAVSPSDVETIKTVTMASINLGPLCLAGDAMNDFMSRNWEVVFQELKPVVDQAISAILTDVASKVFDRFPFAELFPAS